MFVINEDNSIYATRGDIVFFSVSAKDDGVPYHFQPGDVVRIKVYGKKDAESVYLQKDFPVLENCESVDVFLSEEDTKIGEVISKPKDYWYEIELNPFDHPQTIIGYDEDGAKVFKLFPEGDDVAEFVPEPRSIAMLDEELDMTSTRPVQNQAIAGAIARIERDTKKDYVTPQMFGAVGDGIADDTEAFRQLNGKRAYIPVGHYRVSSVEYGANTVIFGGGMGNTIIEQYDKRDEDMFVFKNAHNSGMSNLTLKGNGFERHTPSSAPFVGLLKIYCTTEQEAFSQHCVYEHLQITETPNSGLVILGKDTGSGTAGTMWNWVHHFNDIRVEFCNAWCLIDESTDNRFDNFYLNEGGLGNMLALNGGNNMYANFKLDQPYGSGEHGDPNSWDSGALLVCKNCSSDRFINFDIQSSYYHGVKMSYCSGMHLDANFNNIGYMCPECDPVCIKLDTTHNSTFNCTFIKTSAVTYNVYINSNCSNNVVTKIENEAVPSVNNSSTCVVVDSRDLPTFFNGLKKITTVRNLLTNATPASTAGWSIENCTLDGSSKIVGTYSFKLDGTTNSSACVRQTLSDVKPGHKYLFVATAYTETPSTSGGSTPTPYILIVQNETALTAADSLKGVASNSVGHSVLGFACVPSTADPIRFNVFNYNNNGVYYIGNMYAIDLTDLSLYIGTTRYVNRVFNQFKDTPLAVKTTITESIGYTDVMAALEYLLENMVL